MVCCDRGVDGCNVHCGDSCYAVVSRRRGDCYGGGRRGQCGSGHLEDRVVVVIFLVAVVVFVVVILIFVVSAVFCWC